jgi:hypothetical protein
VVRPSLSPWHVHPSYHGTSIPLTVARHPSYRGTSFLLPWYVIPLTRGTSSLLPWYVHPSYRGTSSLLPWHVIPLTVARHPSYRGTSSLLPWHVHPSYLATIILRLSRGSNPVLSLVSLGTLVCPSLLKSMCAHYAAF